MCPFIVAEKLAPHMVGRLDDLILCAFSLCVINLICGIRLLCGLSLRYSYLGIISLILLPYLINVVRMGLTAVAQLSMLFAGTVCMLFAELSPSNHFGDLTASEPLDRIKWWLPALAAGTIGACIALPWIFTLQRIEKCADGNPTVRLAQLAHLALLALPLSGINISLFTIEPCSNELVSLGLVILCACFSWPRVDETLDELNFKDTKTLSVLFLFTASQAIIPPCLLFVLAAFYTTTTVIPVCMNSSDSLDTPAQFFAPIIASCMLGGVLLILATAYQRSTKTAKVVKND